jgi:hypothetical protein
MIFEIINRLKFTIFTGNLPMEEEYREKMIKQKKEFEEHKKKEGDSDLLFNEKDNRRRKQEK